MPQAPSTSPYSKRYVQRQPYNGSRCPFQTAIECDGPFAGIATGFQADFHNDCKTISLLKGEPGGNGRLLFPLRGKRKMAEGDVSQDYIVDTVK